MAQYTLEELQEIYRSLTARIAALDLDISREIDGERRKTLNDRRTALAIEREVIAKDIGVLHPDYPLTVVASAAQLDKRVSDLEQEVRRIWAMLNPGPRRLVARTLFWGLLGVLLVIWLKSESFMWLIVHPAEAALVTGALIAAALLVWWLPEDDHDKRE